LLARYGLGVGGPGGNRAEAPASEAPCPASSTAGFFGPDEQALSTSNNASSSHGLMNLMAHLQTCLVLVVAPGQQLGEGFKATFYPGIISALPAALGVGLMDFNGLFLKGISLLFQQYVVLLQLQLVQICGALRIHQIAT